MRSLLVIAAFCSVAGTANPKDWMLDQGFLH
jgi:hypothetical protein